MEAPNGIIQDHRYNKVAGKAHCMSEPLKADAAAILEHIETLKKQAWLEADQQWWPDYLFHFTDLMNAVSILERGELLSRLELEKTGAMASDNASPDVISQTDPKWKEYVRLYFRPRTPTQYRNEGFRPVKQRELGGAHCPAPIIFMFDAKKILVQSRTRFSDGNLAAANALVGESAKFFASLPFKKVYHDASLWNFSEPEKRNIIFHRHAEVIFPKRLDLAALKWIWCRSQAEFETLLSSLSEEARRNWEKKIGVSGKPRFFFARWCFVERAELTADAIVLKFNPSTETRGPFHARLEIVESKSGITYTWEEGNFEIEDSQFDLRELKYPERYQVSLWLDGQIAYRNQYLGEESPTF